ncbi:DNA polymerase III subunit beta [Arachidicoccus ginsenosidimutans]|uniref:DNA polymerase III subunit beta n=1 Tax=Arachidicoccus sp. BS20 TaxID=1850526 RepID=UPI0007F16CAA|nr:DNA polymerase III subunit beta [Arachidicoccus sp. BS20]ANI90040.1 DNA polymerase III subunit beta [Arachidicoccus sp. BS20]
MKFIVSSSTLLKQLQQIGGVISSNTVLPILEDFLFEVSDKKLTVVATDLETVMRVQISVESNENGRFCVPAKILLDTLKALPDQPLTLNIESNFAIEITSDNGKYKIMGENPDNFPKDPSEENVNTFTIPSGVLLTAINKTLFAVSTDDLRPAMTGVYFELGKDNIQFVSTDAHRLVRYKRTSVSPDETSNFIVPRKPLNVLKNVLPDNEDELTVSHTENHLFIKHKEISLICRLIDARFPDYKVVIPAENPYTLIINKAAFASALRRVNVFANKSTNLVALSISGNEIQLNAQDVDYNFEGNERLACQYNGEPLQIGFNAKFLSEMLGAINSDDVKMELSTPSKAGLIKPTEQEEDEDLLLLIMPLLIN